MDRLQTCLRPVCAYWQRPSSDQWQAFSADGLAQKIQKRPYCGHHAAPRGIHGMEDSGRRVPTRQDLNQTTGSQIVLTHVVGHETHAYAAQNCKTQRGQIVCAKTRLMYQGVGDTACPMQNPTGFAVNRRHGHRVQPRQLLWSGRAERVPSWLGTRDPQPLLHGAGTRSLE